MCTKRHFDTDPVLYSAMCPMAFCCLCLYMAGQICVIHNPCIIPLRNIIVPTHAQGILELLDIHTVRLNVSDKYMAIFRNVKYKA